MRTKRTRAPTGLTLVEVMVAMALFCVGGLSLAGSMGYGLKLDRVNRETASATLEAQRILEDMRSLTLEEVVKTYNNTPVDDPDGYGTAVGSTFEVSSLTPTAGTPGEATASILMPSVDGQVLEGASIDELGTIGDLNGDGLIDDRDHLTDMKILPVAIRVTWSGGTGTRELTLHTVLRR